MVEFTCWVSWSFDLHVTCLYMYTFTTHPPTTNHTLSTFTTHSPTTNHTLRVFTTHSPTTNCTPQNQATARWLDLVCCGAPSPSQWFTQAKDGGGWWWKQDRCYYTGIPQCYSWHSNCTNATIYSNTYHPGENDQWDTGIQPVHTTDTVEVSTS